MRVFWLCFAVIIEVTSFIVNKRVAFNVNPDFGTITSGIETLPNGQSTINVDANLTKALSRKLMAKFEFYFLKGKSKKSVAPMPWVNYCDVMGGKMLPMQVIQVLVKRLEKFGRLLVPCPIQAGHYYLKRAYIDETQMPMYRVLREGTLYIMEVVVTQKVAGQTVRVFDMQAHYTCNQSNWS